MKKIKNIIIPTDFMVKKSSIFSYTKDLANTLNSDITVLSINADFIEKKSTKEDEIELEKNIETLLNSANNDDKAMLKKPLKLKILRGPYKKFISSKKGDLLVINHSDLPFFLSKVMNLSTLEVSNKANCPVLIIPDQVNWSPIEQILFTDDIDTVTPAMVRTMSDFAEQFDAVIHFVHIPENGKKNNRFTDKIWRELYQKAAVSFPFKLHEIKGANTMKNLKNYIQKHRINLSAFVNKQRHFWHELMHPKITQNLAFGLGMPVMIMYCNSLAQKTKLPNKISRIINEYIMEGESHFF